VEMRIAQAGAASPRAVGYMGWLFEINRFRWWPKAISNLLANPTLGLAAWAVKPTAEALSDARGFVRRTVLELRQRFGRLRPWRGFMQRGDRLATAEVNAGVSVGGDTPIDLPPAAPAPSLAETRPASERTFFERERRSTRPALRRSCWATGTGTCRGGSSGSRASSPRSSRRPRGRRRLPSRRSLLADPGRGSTAAGSMYSTPIVND